MTSIPLTFLFWPESAYGPTNQCIGIGKLLLDRGHRVVFAAESSWRGKLEQYGFEEELVDLAEPPEGDSAGEDAGAFWKEFIRETSPEFRKPTIQQLTTFVKPTFQALIDGAIYCEPRLREIIAKVKPDVVVEDNVVCFPALVTAGVPFVRIVSCNPLEVKGAAVAPALSGYSQEDSSSWNEFRTEYEKTHREMWNNFNQFVINSGAPTLPDLEFIHTSDFANLYVYPAEADYINERPLDPKWTRMDSSVRSTDETYDIPTEIAQRPEGSALVYLSLGSLGSADVDLMKRIISVLGKTQHRFIVSMGPAFDEIELADNMVGSEFLPQTEVIPKVDLVITHGGNNTVTEALHFGKPMILLPLFWDQYDNAQRMDELGFGKRLATYAFTDLEMTDSIAALLDDQELRDRMKVIGENIRLRNGTEVGANVIEQVAREHLNKTNTN
jgi:MGT family glycosyltransferase